MQGVRSTRRLFLPRGFHRDTSWLFHVEQPFSLSTAIRCSDLAFNVGVAGEDHVPEVADTTDGERRDAPLDTRSPGNNHGIWEFWKSEIAKEISG
jgi:hypothetical protein